MKSRTQARRFPAWAWFASSSVIVVALAIGSAQAQVRPQPDEPRPEAQAVDPRDPADFTFGQYHRSSQMTPGGSVPPKTWGSERTDVGPPVPVERDAATSGDSEAAVDDDEARSGAPAPRADRMQEEGRDTTPRR